MAPVRRREQEHTPDSLWCTSCMSIGHCVSDWHAAAAPSAVAWPLPWPRHSCALEPLVSGHFISRLCHWYTWDRSPPWQGYIAVVKREDMSTAGQPPVYIKMSMPIQIQCNSHALSLFRSTLTYICANPLLGKPKAKLMSSCPAHSVTKHRCKPVT